MSNPTTPFSWQMPTATDLVTDLPADFEVFGQAVATSMADLLGGTSGQILAKNSNTDMDFVWIANDQGDITGITASSPLTGGGTSGAVTLGILSGTTSNLGAVQLSDSTSSTSTTLAATANAVKTTYDLADGAIAKTTVTTAGDIIYRNATVPTRLGIGTANQVLTVNAGATAPEWKTPAAAASGMTLIARTTFSNVASQAFDSVFTSTYTNYLVVIDNIYAVDGGDDLYLQLRYAGPTTQTASYYGSSFGSPFSGATFNTQSNNASQLTISTQTGSSSTFGAGNIYFNSVGNASEIPNFRGQYLDKDANSYFFGGQINVARTYTGFLLKSSSTNITGAVSIYGLAKS